METERRVYYDKLSGQKYAISRGWDLAYKLNEHGTWDRRLWFKLLPLWIRRRVAIWLWVYPPFELVEELDT